jgi:hypothetical protein
MAKPVSCWFNMTIKDKAWKSPDNFAAQCTP